jgi:signal transduction histidine kinase
LSSLLSDDYLPHRYCYLVKPWLVWTNVSTDALIGASYGLIFVCLIWMTLRLWRVEGLRTFLWIFLSFGLFILACGATHLMEVVTVWWPLYPLSAAFKVVCAAISVPTALFFAGKTPSLTRALETYLKTLSDTERQRDSALLALSLAQELEAHRRKAASQLAHAYERLNAVLSCTSDSVITLSYEWILVYANPRAIEKNPELKVGEDYWAAYPALIGTRVEAAMRRAMEERSVERFDSYYEPLDTHYKVQVYPTDEGISIFYMDVTVEWRREEQLETERTLRERRVEALSHMAGGLAHEISNPLAIIHGRATDLRDLAEATEAVGSDEVRRACDGVLKTCERASNILRGLRGFARDAKNDPMQMASIEEILDECMEMQETRFERHHVELRVEISPGLPLLMCRETQVGQILTNLLNNSFDAITQADCEDRWVKVKAAAGEGSLVVEVSDSGPGIREEDKPHLMQPFFTTKEMGLGMGVGLSLSRAIALDHHGSLMLDDDQGRTCFRLVLPLEQDVSLGDERGEPIST